MLLCTPICNPGSRAGPRGTCLKLWAALSPSHDPLNRSGWHKVMDGHSAMKCVHSTQVEMVLKRQNTEERKEAHQGLLSESKFIQAGQENKNRTTTNQANKKTSDTTHPNHISPKASQWLHKAKCKKCTRITRCQRCSG